MNTQTLIERLHWNRNAHVCQMWERQNPLIRNGVNVTVAQGIDIEKNLQVECAQIGERNEYLAMGHAVAILLVAIVTFVFFPGFIKTGLIMLAAIAVAGVSLLITSKVRLKKKTLMHDELMLHQNRTHRLADYIKALSETLLLDEKHLFVFPDIHLSYLADTCLKGLADIVLYHETCGNHAAKETAKVHFKISHGLFVHGGLIPNKPYDKYFQRQGEDTGCSDVKTLRI